MVHSDQPMDVAETLARSYVMDQLWVIQSLEASALCTPALLVEFEQPEVDLVQRARHKGIAAYYSAAPKEERDYVEIHSLGKPPFSDPSGNH
jgi:GTP:adenosylcobinamide-phosphate guanylyltransferase